MKPLPILIVTVGCFALGYGVAVWRRPVPTWANSEPVRYQFHQPGIVFDPTTGDTWARGVLISYVGDRSTEYNRINAEVEARKHPKTNSFTFEEAQRSPIADEFGGHLVLPTNASTPPPLSSEELAKRKR